MSLTAPTALLGQEAYRPRP